MSIIKSPMLASHLDLDVGINFDVLATMKLDGIRCLRIDGKTLSRKFLPIPNGHIQTVMSHLPDELDGELIVEGASFNEIQGWVMSEDGKPDFRYYVFDYVPKSLTEPYDERMQRLEALTLPSFCVKLSIPKLIRSMAELDKYEEKCLSRGYEGVMIRSPKGPYKCGRATAKQGYLLKVKRFRDSEAEVIGFEEQMSNQNEATTDELGHTKRSKCQEGLVPAGILGKLIVQEVGDTPWKGKTFGMGSGFDAAERKEIWEHQKKYLGKIVTYKYQPHGCKDLPRIPIYKGFRSPDDMS